MSDVHVRGTTSSRQKYRGSQCGLVQLKRGGLWFGMNRWCSVIRGGYIHRSSSLLYRVRSAEYSICTSGYIQCVELSVRCFRPIIYASVWGTRYIYWGGNSTLVSVDCRSHLNNQRFMIDMMNVASGVHILLLFLLPHTARWYSNNNCSHTVSSRPVVAWLMHAIV